MAGDWSDGSPLWTRELREVLREGPSKDDGKFWMAFDDCKCSKYSEYSKYSGLVTQHSR